MSHPVFSDAWAAACAAAINGHEAYRRAASGWEGAILLRMHAPGGHDRRVFLDLWHGECREARAASEEDEALARYILSGALDTWRQVLTGELAPLHAVIGGRLRLAKGSLADLLPYVNAARELVLAAGTVAVVFPDLG